MTATQIHARKAALAALPYTAADLDVQLQDLVRAVAGSGLEGCHAACVTLNKARRVIRRTVGRLSAQEPFEGCR